MNNVKKVILGSLVTMSMMSTTVFAGSDWCNFNLGDKVGYGNLDVTWNSYSADRGWARTSYPGDSKYKATVYLEAENSGSSTASFSYGTTYAERTIDYNANRFNSSHGVADYSSNVYSPLSYDTCTDW